MKSAFRSLALSRIIALVAAFVVMAMAQAQQPTQPTPANEAIIAAAQAMMMAAKQAELANALIDYGRQQRSALALINAVQILDGIPAKVLLPGESGTGGKAYERAALLAEAQDFAGEQPELKELIKDIQAAKPKGPKPSVPCLFEWVCNSGCSYVCR